MPGPQDFPSLKSALCTEATLMRPDVQRWTEWLKEEPGKRHRKIWEWCYICQALEERDMLRPGRRGLGFAVGQEALASVFASRGVKVLATDLHVGDASARGWIDTSQHADSHAALNKRGICDEERFRELVEFRYADMNALGPELRGGFDFIWSACAFEHLGSIERGKAFVLNAMESLKPGGVAVHTTEFNVSSDTDTVAEGETVLYRRRDIEDIADALRADGHHIELEFDAGNSIADGTIDVPPYKHDTHLKLQIGSYTVTSMALVITRRKAKWWWPFRR